MFSRIFKFIILGAPASGKGTLSSRIVNRYNLEHISSGDKLRLHIKNNTDLGIQAKKYINEGKLVPDQFMIELISNELKKVNNKHWLLDGFPRTILQAEQLWNLEKVDLVINLNVPFDVIIERVKGRWIHLPSGRVYNTDFNAPKVFGKDDITGEDLVQRNDDKPEVVMKRLKDYETITKPLIDFYENMKILRTFSGNTSNEIWPKLSDCLTTYISMTNTKK